MQNQLAQNNQSEQTERPTVLIIIAVLGIALAIAGIIGGVLNVWVSAKVLSATLPSATTGKILGMLFASAFGAIAAVFFVSAILRLIIAIGLLKMRRWAYRLFYVIVALSALAFVSAVFAGVFAWLAGTLFVIECGILWYVFRLKNLLH